ncbi:MAG: hypothetical protein NT157_02850 [Candidatus Micrarchaeota archaeon]|nr:hypothetical protein [Candidatus Micrarchaeota archaeon]
MGEELVGLIPRKLEIDAVQRFRSEQTIFEKYGKEGVSLYMQIDGMKTVAELIASGNVKEEKVLEILKELEKLRLVRMFTVFELEAEEK